MMSELVGMVGQSVTLMCGVRRATSGSGRIGLDEIVDWFTRETWQTRPNGIIVFPFSVEDVVVVDGNTFVF